MPRDESFYYGIERRRWATQPALFVRASHVPNWLNRGTEYPFSTDFSTMKIKNPTRPKLLCVRRIGGQAQSVDPVAGSSTVGATTVELVDVGGEITRYVADPALGLNTNMDASTTTIQPADSVLAYPARGHLIIDDEDIKYTGLDVDTNSFTGVVRAQRGTTAAAHLYGALVHNGERLARGARMTLWLGYAPLDEIDYGPGPGFANMDVMSIQSADNGGAWVIVASDIQRFTKRSIFKNATTDAPFETGLIHPITLALQVLLSTGNGSNSAYDNLSFDDGGAIPKNLVDITRFETYRDQFFPTVQMKFRESAPTDLKAFVEGQCLRPMNIFPLVNARGQYSCKLMRTPEFLRSALGTGHAHVAV